MLEDSCLALEFSLTALGLRNGANRICGVLHMFILLLVTEMADAHGCIVCFCYLVQVFLKQMAFWQLLKALYKAKFSSIQSIH